MANVYTLAAQLPKKPNKAECFDLVNLLIETGEKPTDEVLAILYAFFMPTITSVKTPFEWLVKARAKKDVRYYLNHVYNDGKRFISTDGHRLHIVKDAREPGWYDDKQRYIHSADWAKYPNVDSIITGLKDTAYDLIDFKTLQVKKIGELTVYDMPDGTGINIKYLKEALSLSDDYEIKYYPSHQKLQVIHSNGAKAIVMGIRCK